MIMLLFYKEMMYLKITFKKILVNCKIARKIENSIRYSYQGYVGSFSGILIIFVYYFLRRFLYFFVMFSTTVWKKYIFRVLKLITLVFLCQQVINAKLLGKSPKEFNAFYTINNIVCIVSGKSSPIKVLPTPTSCIRV